MRQKYAMLYTRLTVILCLITFGLSQDKLNTVLVSTELGPIQGLEVIVPETNAIVYEFRGIRYGKPTNGSLRFKKPEAFGHWIGTLDGTRYSHACPQARAPVADYVTPKMSEDCLALNIYVPKSYAQSNTLSVMIWIYGGALMMGHAHQYDGSKIASEGEVIVVTINYRVGVLGFLALDDPAARGNYGVWDQKLAIEWVHEHISAFGGDPESVTLFGESAGGWSVNLQTLIPSNKGLFKRAIAQSGALDFGRTKMPSRTELREKAKKLADKMKCPFDELNDFVECLRTKDAQELMDATSDRNPGLANNQLIITAYCAAAVVDGELIKEHPFKLLQDPTSDVSTFFKSVDYMSGTTSQEGSLLWASLGERLQTSYGFNLTEGVPIKFACEAIINPYVNMYLNNDADIKRRICEFYTENNSKNAQSLKVLELYGDIMFTYPVIRMLDYHAAFGGLTWQYVFSKQSSYPWAGPFPKWYKGAAHADELLLMFPSEPLIGVKDVSFTDEEKELSRTFIRYLTNFAKTGLPSDSNHLQKWENFETDSRHYIDFDTPIKSKSHYIPKRIKFWNDILSESISSGHSEL